MGRSYKTERVITEKNHAAIYICLPSHIYL
jgi:hypothetical protein